MVTGPVRTRHLHRRGEGPSRGLDRELTGQAGPTAAPTPRRTLPPHPYVSDPLVLVRKLMDVELLTVSTLPLVEDVCLSDSNMVHVDLYLLCD